MSEVEQERVETTGAETRILEPGAEAPQPTPRRAETRVLESDAGETSQALAAVPHLGLTREELNWAALAHASILITLLLGLVSGGIGALLGPIIPGIIWYVHRDKSDYVVEQARQATIYQVAGMVALVALILAGGILVSLGLAISAVMIIILIGLILFPIMVVVTLIWGAAIVVLPIAQVVYGCYAALEAYNGRPFRYWWVADQIDRYQAQT